jgi:hypothetical protein
VNFTSTLTCFHIVVTAFHYPGREAGSDDVTQSERLGELLRLVLTIHEQQASFQEKQDSFEEKSAIAIAALQNSVNRTSYVVEANLSPCDMSHATQKNHAGMFQFNYDDHNAPPMVSSGDARVAPLVEALRKYRNGKGFSRINEALCCTKAFRPFFTEFARSLRSSMIVPDADQYCLKVNIGNTSFTGRSDIVVGLKGCFPQLVIEVKPMAGNCSLQGKTFSELPFSTRTQVVLQCAAFQSLCKENGKSFSCVLTDLLTMYVVQVESFNSRQICAKIFSAVTDEKDFIRALLFAYDSNELISKRSTCFKGPIVCFTAEGYDSNRPPEVPFTQVPSGSSSPGRATSQVSGAKHSSLAGAKCSRNEGFESLLPPACQKHGIRTNFTEAWMVLTERVPFSERCSDMNVSTCESVPNNTTSCFLMP